MAQEFNPERLLSIWEENWGKLSDEWRREFLLDSRLNEILLFSESSIHMGVAKYKKLDSLLGYLQETSAPNDIKVEKSAQGQSKSGSNNAIRRMQLERVMEPKIPDQDWWRGK